MFRLFQFLFAVFLLLISTCMAHAVTNMVYVAGTLTTVHTGSSTLTNNSRVLSSAVTWTGSEGTYLFAHCELNIPAPSGTVAANSNMIAWWITDVDATNYEIGDASNEPAKEPDIKWPLLNSSGAQRVIARFVKMPAKVTSITPKLLIKNNGTGVTINTTWTVKCLPLTPAM